MCSVAFCCCANTREKLVKGENTYLGSWSQSRAGCHSRRACLNQSCSPNGSQGEWGGGQAERQRCRGKVARQDTIPVTDFLQLGPTSYASITCPSHPSQGARLSIHETMVTGRTELKLLWRGGGGSSKMEKGFLGDRECWTPCVGSLCPHDGTENNVC